MREIVGSHALARALRRCVSRLGLSVRLVEVVCNEWSRETESISGPAAPHLVLRHGSTSGPSPSGQCLNLYAQQLPSFVSSEPLLHFRRAPDQKQGVTLRNWDDLILRLSRRRLHQNSRASSDEVLDTRECWSCHSEKPGTEPFFCPSCGKIQPVNPLLDYFTLLNMEGRYPIDARQLEATYKALQKRLHPDMFSTKSEEERTHSASQAAHVIKAYYTLLRPLDRAKYLLQLLGEDVLANDEGTIDNQDLLMEMMEVREAVGEAADDEELKRIAAENDVKREKCLASLTAAFERGDLKAAKSLMHRLTYLERISAEILRRQ